jgi:hypothetical protein
VPDCILCICRNYRDLFSSDEAMAGALGISPDKARRIIAGAEIPDLDTMIVIQALLREQHRASTDSGAPVLS